MQIKTSYQLSMAAIICFQGASDESIRFNYIQASFKSF